MLFLSQRRSAWSLKVPAFTPLTIAPLPGYIHRRAMKKVRVLPPRSPRARPALKVQNRKARAARRKQQSRQQYSIKNTRKRRCYASLFLIKPKCSYSSSNTYFRFISFFRASMKLLSTDNRSLLFGSLYAMRIYANANS